MRYGIPLCGSVPIEPYRDVFGNWCSRIVAPSGQMRLAADGVVRARTNRGHALLHGQCVPLVGIISMDLTMLDVTDLPNAKIGDVVTIYGQDGAARIQQMSRPYRQDRSQPALKK